MAAPGCPVGTLAGGLPARDPRRPRTSALSLGAATSALGAAGLGATGLGAAGSGLGSAGLGATTTAGAGAGAGASTTTGAGFSSRGAGAAAARTSDVRQAVSHEQAQVRALITHGGPGVLPSLAAACSPLAQAACPGTRCKNVRPQYKASQGPQPVATGAGRQQLQHSPGAGAGAAFITAAGFSSTGAAAGVGAG